MVLAGSSCLAKFARMTERPEDEQAAEDAADAAGIDVEDLADEEHEAPVDTPAERAYSIRAAVAGVRSTRRAARVSLAVVDDGPRIRIEVRPPGSLFSTTCTPGTLF